MASSSRTAEDPDDEDRLPAALRSKDAQALHKFVDLEMNEKLVKVIKGLLGHGKKANEFKRPVQIPDYEKTIKQPMDLNRVLKTLGDREAAQKDPRRAGDLALPFEKKRYQVAGDFAHDVRLVFKNAFLFNLPTHFVFKDAFFLAKKFEDEFAKVEKAAEKNGPRCSLQTRCQLLLTDLRRNPYSEWFRRPDDWQSFGEAYLDALKSGCPMDLDTIQKQMDSGAYGGVPSAERAPSAAAAAEEAATKSSSSAPAAAASAEAAAPSAEFDIEAFASDVRLVWQNALDFNGDQSQFSTMVKLLRIIFDQRLKDLTDAPTPKAAGGDDAAAGDPEALAGGRKRRRELMDLCSRLTSNIARTEMAALVEETCAAAVRRRGPSSNNPKDDDRADVNLDALSEAQCAHLVEKARALLPPAPAQRATRE